MLCYVMKAFMYNEITNWLSKTNKPRESLYLLKFIYWLFRLSAHPRHPTICSCIHHQSGFVEIAIINRLHCLICRFHALWGDQGMLTLTLNLIITSKRSLMNCRNKMKKTWQKICCRVTFHCIEAWHHNVKRYGALAFSNTKLEKYPA